MGQKEIKVANFVCSMKPKSRVDILIYRTEGHERR